MSRRLLFVLPALFAVLFVVSRVAGGSYPASVASPEKGLSNALCSVTIGKITPLWKIHEGELVFVEDEIVSERMRLGLSKVVKSKGAIFIELETELGVRYTSPNAIVQDEENWDQNCLKMVASATVALQ